MADEEDEDIEELLELEETIEDEEEEDKDLKTEESADSIPTGLASLGDMIEDKVMNTVKQREERIRDSMKKTVRERERKIREKMQERIDRAREKHEEEKAKLMDQLEKEREGKEEIRKELQEKIDELREKIDEKTSEIDQLKEQQVQEKNELREKHQKEIKELNQEIDELKDEHTKEKEALREELQREKEELREEHEQEKKELREKQQEELRELNQDIDELKDKHTKEKEALREELQQEKEELRKRYEQEKEELRDDHENEITELQDKIEELRNRLEQKEREAEQRREELRDKLEQEKKELKETYEEEKKELRYNLEREKADMKNRLREEIEDLRERLEEERERSGGGIPGMMGSYAQIEPGLAVGDGLQDRMKKRLKEPSFPFPAIVGQERMKRALLLNAINPKINGVLIWGNEGCGKRTAIISLAELLSEIEGVETEEEIRVWNDEERYINGTIHSLKTDATLMVDKGLKNGAMNVKKLDSCEKKGTPIITVENLSFFDKYMLSYLDSFDLQVKVEMIEDIDGRREIIRRKKEYEESPQAFYEEYEDRCHELRDRIVRTRQTLSSVTIGSRQRNTISNLSAHASLPSGSDIMLEEISKTITAYDDREEVTDQDIQEAVDIMFVSKARDFLVDKM